MAAPTKVCDVRFSLPTRSRPHVAQTVVCCEAVIRLKLGDKPTLHGHRKSVIRDLGCVKTPKIEKS